MITTIQIHQEVKRELDTIKKDKESYEETILRLIKSEEEQRKRDKKLLIEQCKEMYEDDLKITKEFEPIDAELDWEW